MNIIDSNPWKVPISLPKEKPKWDEINISKILASHLVHNSQQRANTTNSSKIFSSFLQPKPLNLICRNQQVKDRPKPKQTAQTMSKGFRTFPAHNTSIQAQELFRSTSWPQIIQLNLSINKRPYKCLNLWGNLSFHNTGGERKTRGRWRRVRKRKTGANYRRVFIAKPSALIFELKFQLELLHQTLSSEKEKEQEHAERSREETSSKPLNIKFMENVEFQENECPAETIN